MPETLVPWGEIRQRALAVRPASPRRRLMPRTRAGFAFAVLLVMLFGAAGFAATGWIDEILQDSAPEIVEENLGVPLDEGRTVDGVTFTLERAYADEDNVVVGYSVEGFENWNKGYPTEGMPRVSDGSDRAYQYVGGGGIGTGGPGHDPEDRERLSDLAFFDPTDRLDPSAGHHFRFELDLSQEATGPSGKNAPDAVVFDFKVPVNEVDTIDVGQTVETNGVPVTLRQVTNSPARTEALLCFDPPRDEELTWVPIVERPRLAQSDVFSNERLYFERPEEATGCVEYDLFRSLHDDPGGHSITVTQLQGRSGIKVNPDETVEGPWTFEFEVPEG